MELSEEQKDYAQCMRGMIICFNKDCNHTCNDTSTTYKMFIALLPTESNEKYIKKDMFITINKPCKELWTCPEHSGYSDAFWAEVKIINIQIGTTHYNEQFNHLNTPIILWSNRLGTRPTYIRLWIKSYSDDENDNSSEGGYIWVSDQNRPWKEGDLGTIRQYYITDHFPHDAIYDK